MLTDISYFLLLCGGKTRNSGEDMSKDISQIFFTLKRDIISHKMPVETNVYHSTIRKKKKNHFLGRSQTYSQGRGSSQNYARAEGPSQNYSQKLCFAEFIKQEYALFSCLFL